MSNSVLRKLINVVRTARSEVPVYRDLYERCENIYSLEDFSGLPIVAKSVLAKVGLIQSISSKQTLCITRTYGSEPQLEHHMPKLLSLEDVNSDFDLLRFFMDPVIQRAVQPQRIMIITDDLHLYAAAELGNQLTYYEWPLTLFTASNESRSELSSYLRWFEPTVMFLDADKTLLEGMGHPSLKYIFTFNQIGRGPEIRHINHIYDILRDELAGPIAIACDRSYQYIFDSSLFYFETGQDGRLLVTSLFNQLQPLIRYALPYTATLLSSSTFRIDPNSLDNV